jgi:tRNA(fMet)-specific endonuclease VapC
LQGTKISGSGERMSGFGLDTNIVSLYMKGNKTVKFNLEETGRNAVTMQIVPFAWYEIQRGLLAVKAIRQLQEFADLCNKIPVGRIDNSVLKEAANIHVELKAKGRPTDEMDIFIAAYCKIYDLTLVTNNTRHFAVISGLSLVDWSV